MKGIEFIKALVYLPLVTVAVAVSFYQHDEAAMGLSCAAAWCAIGYVALTILEESRR